MHIFTMLMQCGFQLEEQHQNISATMQALSSTGGASYTLTNLKGKCLKCNVIAINSRQTAGDLKMK